MAAGRRGALRSDAALASDRGVPKRTEIPAAIPVREMRVLYGLKDDHYAGFARHQLPHAHEFFAPMRTLTEANSEDNPRLLALIERASVSANFYNQTD